MSDIPRIDFPRIIDTPGTFNALVEWIHDDLIKHRGAPGVIIGISGTDSLVVFLAAYRAFEKAGKPNRVWGVHFSPSEEFVDDHPEAEQHLWFSKEIVPWLEKECPDAKITIDSSIDWRMDGVRWGMLSEMGTVSYEHGRKMREHDDRFWVIGTRNRTETLLFTFSNASMVAGFQPLVHLWKSEVLQLSKFLGIPQLAIDKSCDVDCICGRQRLPAHHICEVDWILMVNEQELNKNYIMENIERALRIELSNYIQTQITRSSYKRNIPVCPSGDIIHVDWYVTEFDNCTLDLRRFNHQNHVYVAWYYLKQLPFDEAVKRYCNRLKILLNNAGVGHKFNYEMTTNYFHKINEAMNSHPNRSFDELSKLI
jgi:NH3-dependent NAD+ synthetase